MIRRIGATGILAVVMIAAAALHIRAATRDFTVSYYDSYVYLLGARAIVDPAIEYPVTRPPLLPAVLALCAGAGPVSLDAARTLALAFHALCLVAGFLYFRARFPSQAGLAGLALLALNPLVIHYAAFPMTDIPATALFAAASLAYLAATRRSSRAAWTIFGVLLALTILMRHNLAALLAVPLLAEWLTRNRAGSSLGSAAFWIGGLALAVAATASGFALLFITEFGLGVEAFKRLWAAASHLPKLPASSVTDPWWEHFESLPRILGWPATLALCAGVARTLRTRGRAETFALLAFATLILFQSFATTHKEARYLLPSLPSLIFLALFGLEPLLARDGSRKSLHAAALLILVVGAAPAARESLADLADPVYRTRAWNEAVAEIERGSAPGAPIYTTGAGTPLFSANPSPYPNDEFHRVLHLGRPTLAFLTGREARHLGELVEEVGGDSLPLRLAERGSAVVDLYPEKTTNRFRPDHAPPIVIHSYRIGALPPVLGDSAPVDAGVRYFIYRAPGDSDGVSARTRSVRARTTTIQP